MTPAEKLHVKIAEYVKYLQKFADRVWYGPLIGLLAALDNIVVIIPNDGILISSSMLTPRRWLLLALCVAIGSTIGAAALSLLVETHGLDLVMRVYPGINETTSWVWMEKFFDRYGLFLVFFVAITPIAQQPAVILASLAATPLVELVAVVFSGRLIKFLIMAYIGSHAPALLSKMWGVRGELEEVGVKIK
ncbi:MAG TPA: VTT domain-containing protein [Bdellovibrionales bacterium]|nr:VTT domain-containing protein [Bdellovibrionales bacterium]